jgi:hypothetical protein
MLAEFLHCQAENMSATTVALDLERVQVPDRDLAHLPACEWCLNVFPE